MGEKKGRKACDPQRKRATRQKEKVTASGPGSKKRKPQKNSRKPEERARRSPGGNQIGGGKKGELVEVRGSVSWGMGTLSWKQIL